MRQDVAPNPDIVEIVRDPLWYADRYHPGHDAVHFRRVTREDHRAATFLGDDFLPKIEEPLILRRADVMAALPPRAPVHFIFHSAFCCSSVLARAFDIPGVAMGLKEPLLFNDIVGWSHRGGTPREIAPVLDDLLAVLSRPFSPSEAVVIKPSNIGNGLAPAMLMMRPQAKALLLHAPLDVYLGSIARKGMEGRIWVRELVVKQLREGLHGFGYSTEDYIGQTDFQIAAIGWLAQHALFKRMIDQFGPDRVRSIDSERLMVDPTASMSALAALFGLAFDVPAVVAGPAFTRHSKFGSNFDAAARSVEINRIPDVHAEEIAKVMVWAEKLAEAANLSLELPAPLLG